MFCSGCGAQVGDDQKFCKICGAPLKVQAAPIVQQPVPQPAQPVSQVPASPVKVSKGFAIAGFILGIDTVAFCFIIFANILSIFTGLPGLIFSILGLVKKNGKLKPMALIGLILSVFGLFVSGLIWASFWSDDAYKLAEFLFSWMY
ncbi:MAG: zinc ribbon domain-containing protein [Clostridiales bacterium]|nr:zinc ribbon domain-containing protein [Clostridiales bacterium]